MALKLLLKIAHFGKISPVRVPSIAEKGVKAQGGDRFVSGCKPLRDRKVFQKIARSPKPTGRVGRDWLNF